MKKRILAAYILFCLLLGLCGCEKENKPSDSYPSLYERGLEVVSLMEEMIKSDSYTKMYSSSSDIQEVVRKMAEGDYKTHKVVYRITMPEKALSTLMTLAGTEGEFSGLPDSLKELMESKLNSTFVNQLNASGGAAILAASSVCTVSKTFVNWELEENESTIYLYTYENATPIAVSFLAGEDGAVSATGTFLLYENFHAESEQAIRDSLGLFTMLGEFDLKIETVTE